MICTIRRDLIEAIITSYPPFTANVGWVIFCRCARETSGFSGVKKAVLAAICPSSPLTKVAQIYKKVGNLRAVRLLLGHTKIDSTVPYLAWTSKMHCASPKGSTCSEACRPAPSAAVGPKRAFLAFVAPRSTARL